MKTEYGIPIRWVRGSEQKGLQAINKVFGKGTIQAGPYGYLPPAFISILDNLHYFKWRPSDTILIGYPKTGTSWVQQIIWTMKNDPNLDHPCSDLLNNFKVGCLEIEGFFNIEDVCSVDKTLMPKIRKYCPTLPNENFNYIDLPDHMPDPRIIKTHFGFDVLDTKALDTCKVILLMRNPKEALVSYYYFIKDLSITQYQGTLEQYIDSYLSGNCLFGKIFHLMKNVLKYRDHPNMLILYYEEMVKDTLSGVKKLNQFLQTNLNTKQIENVIHKTNFEVMKEKDPFYFGEETFRVEGDFYRKGQVGSHKEVLSPEAIEKINKACRKELHEYLNFLPYDFQN